MATRKVELEGCPLPSCDLAVAMALATTDGTKLTTTNLNQDRTCLYPTTLTVEGEEVPGSFIVYHRTLEKPNEAAENGADADAEVLDVEDLPGKKRRLYQELKDATTDEEAVSKAALMGKLQNMDMSPEYIEKSLESLKENGYVVEEATDRFAPVV